MFMDYDAAAEYWLKKDKEFAAMPEEALRERIYDFLKANNTCALATASADMVRCTPIEYLFVDGCFYLFSEGGLKFRALKDNKSVGIAVYAVYEGFGKLKGLQAEGEAQMIEPFSEEYVKICECRKIPVEAMKKMAQPLHLIKVVPSGFDYLDSELKKEGYGVRQHMNV